MRIFALLCALLMALPAVGAKPKMMSIQNRETQLRSAPTYFSKVLVTLAYTERVAVLETQTTWSKVRHETSGQEGWLNTSALTSKTLTLSATGQDAETGVSTEEQALAGKGFNPQVEAEYKKRSKEINYDAVDRMETVKVSLQEIEIFLRNGGIALPKGGAK